MSSGGRSWPRARRSPGQASARPLRCSTVRFTICWSRTSSSSCRRRRRTATLVDLGCGTGAAGAAWARRLREPPASGHRSPSVGGRRSGRTYRAFRPRRVRPSGDIANVGLQPGPASILAAFTMNELPDAARDALLTRLVDRGAHQRRSRSCRRTARRFRGALVEPLARQRSRRPAAGPTSGAPPTDFRRSWRSSIARPG